MRAGIAPGVPPHSVHPKRFNLIALLIHCSNDSLLSVRCVQRLDTFAGESVA